MRINNLGSECSFLLAEDEFGNAVRKTKSSHPYSYDGHVSWRGGKNEETNSTIYSDRIFEQDSKKHDELCQKYWGNRGQRWGSRSPESIESFLKEWTGQKDLKLILVMEYCNQSSGYPLWRFDFNHPKVTQ